MKTLIRQILVNLCLSITLVSLSASADDFEVEQTLEGSAESEDNNNGGFLKLGFGRQYKDSLYDYSNEWTLFVNGRYQWHGLFIEYTNSKDLSNQGPIYGFNFYNTEQWNFDLNVRQVHHASGILFSNENEQFFNVSRDETKMLVLRATGSFEQTSVEFSISPYSLNDEYDDGVYASFWADRAWQVKNWQFNAAIGLTYRSAEILNHYYGTPDGPIIEGFDYQASAGVDVTAQIGVSYPISENWIFESYFRYTDITDSITDSPFKQRHSQNYSLSENAFEFGILVSYVF
ncbi:MAG: outer membrane protein [Paraglaciecola sp.]|jgi:outer membrane protein